MSAPVIQLRDLAKTYQTGGVSVAAVRGVTLDIRRGDFVAVMGASGSGKSTLMNTLGCLDQPTRGNYLLNGVGVAGLDRRELAELRNRQLGFVFQSFNLLARTSALENVELPLIYRGDPPHTRHVQARAALAQVGLTGWEHHTPGELSGGQQQRVAIARAMVTRPVLLLADEPTGNLDSERSIEIMQLLAAVNRDHGITIIMVTHEPDMAAFARRTVHFKDGLIFHDHAHAGGG